MEASSAAPGRPPAIGGPRPPNTPSRPRGRQPSGRAATSPAAQPRSRPRPTKRFSGVKGGPWHNTTAEQAPRHVSMSAAPGALQDSPGAARSGSASGVAGETAPRGVRLPLLRCRSASAHCSKGVTPISGAPPTASLLGQRRPGRVNKEFGPLPEQSLTECRPSCWLASSAPRDPSDLVVFHQAAMPRGCVDAESRNQR
ncbi:hypothetical protein NDU88_006273 [Pleurodeles waltl]|uniref:Uncharacterized protein n=1 Tax=Pleurodeles waltl TaxID=8319 RepID=A0AAV7RQR5_PLEWA|nr:hypothetical protein NDU88_006273 [Pleurodeles waltl]